MLQIKNIHKEYKTGTLVQKALDDVSLNLRDNEFVAILGPSGSGKTTLLNIVGGLDRYDSGDLIINGVSKLYGLTGLRIGWAVSARKDLIAAMGRMQAQSTSCNSDLSETAACAALNGDQGCIADMCRVLEDNRNTLLEEVAKIPNIKVQKPMGTFYSFVDFSHYNKSSAELAQFLLEKALVAVVPGVAFGADGYLRISFCADKASIIEGVRRIRWALDNTQPNELKIGDKILKRN